MRFAKVALSILLPTCAVMLPILCADPAQAQTTLGTFTFNNNQFGNTLLESDGGTFSSTNFLNVVNTNPGNPAYLTGANFNTGIANIGNFGAFPTYTIRYNTPIVNGAGDDLGLVAARYSSDTFTVSVSTDSSTFTNVQTLGPATGVNTGVGRTYFYQGSPTPATLYVSPIDLSSFGIALGNSIVAVRISSQTGGDLIRVAGFGSAAPPVPEPGSLVLLTGLSLTGAAFRCRRKQSAHKAA